MKVYYDSGLRSKGKSLHGLPQRTNWEFEYAGDKRYISIIFRFPKGIVFDVITVLDEIKLREFFNKHEAIRKTLTPLQQRCAEQEHPYQAIPIKEIWTNGKHVAGGYSSSGTVSMPWLKPDDELMPVRKAYSSILKDITCFACDRFCVPYPKTDSKARKIMRFFRLDRVNSMKLVTHSVSRFYPLDIHFEMSAGENPKTVCFKYPITGVTHTLYFQYVECVEVPAGAVRNRSLYAMQSMYEIEPALPQGDTLQFNNSIQYTEPADDRFSPIAASSIGIFSRAGGFAVLTKADASGKAVPCGLHGLPLHCCFSVPSFHKEETSHFVIEGINIKNRDGREYSFQ